MEISKYSGKYHIRSYECDCNGMLRLPTLMNIFQDMADNHAQALGLGMEYVLSKGFAWVGSNYVLDIERLPQIHEDICIHTWPAEEKRLGAIRDFEVFDANGKSIIRASSQWILIDFKRKRPIGLRENLPEYNVLPERVLQTDFAKLPDVERVNNTYAFKARFDDIDINKHVNNAVYILWASESVAPEYRLGHMPKHIEIAFKKEGHWGEDIQVLTQMEGKRSLHNIYSCIESEKCELARVYIDWE